MTYSLPHNNTYHPRQPSMSSTKSGLSAYTNDSFTTSRASTITSNSSSSTRYGLTDIERDLAKMNMRSSYMTSSSRDYLDKDAGRSSPRSSPSPMASPTKAGTPIPGLVKSKTASAAEIFGERSDQVTRKINFDGSPLHIQSTLTPSSLHTRPTLQKNDSDPSIHSYSDLSKPLRPQSMFLQPSLTASPISVNPNDFGSMKNSSVSHLRTLSKDGGAIVGAIPGARNVAGMQGRKRLTRVQTAGDKTSWAQRDWMDRQRKYLQAYEYLCHIGEAKEWIEKCIEEDIPPIVQLEEALRNGITLARLVKVFAPDLVPRIFMDPKLQFRHSDNIVRFFKFVQRVGLPDIFVFELTDLYDKKNIPKVIYCIHALSFMLFKLGMTDNVIGNLVGKLEFTEDELQNTQRGLDMSGVSLPSFRGVEKHFDPVPEPEPVETEEERIERELDDAESSVAQLQALAKGALVRIRLGWMMEDLWNTEERIVMLQSMIRGMFAREVFAYKADMAAWATELQTLARGCMVRRDLARKQQVLARNKKQILSLQSIVRAKKVRGEQERLHKQLSRCVPTVSKLQAIVRGSLHRRQFQNHMDTVMNSTDDVASLQAMIRGNLTRRRLQTHLDNVYSSEDIINSLQARIRANVVRQNITRNQDILKQEIPRISALQSACRGSLLRREHASHTQRLDSSLKAIVAMQARIRGGEARRQFNNQLDQLHAISPAMTVFNASCRAYLVRKSLSEKVLELERLEPLVAEVQAISRGRLARQSFTSKCQALKQETPKVCNLQALARGALFRGQQNVFIAELHTNHWDDISSLQACIRGALSRRDARFTVECLIDEEPEVVELQSLLRGAITRKAFHGKLKHYKENMERVVKIQSFIRAKQQGEAYKSLTTGKNPPVGTIKNFVHLLNDSDFDFNEEIEFERKRKTLVQHVRANEVAEHYIEELDIKIGLLIRNKITLDEVVKYQKLGGLGGVPMSNTDLSSKDPFDLKALNKSSRRKLELYQILFFALQTQPVYLSRLFKRARAVGTSEKDFKRLENLVIGLFGYATKRREEFFLLKLIGQNIRDELQSCNEPQDFLRGNFFWAKLMVNYIRSPRDKKYMRDFLGSTIRERVIEVDHLDLENNPLQIYKTIINNEELSTGRRSVRKQDISREEAIRDPETRQIFVQHLEDLRDLAETFLDVLEENVARIPFGVRHLAQISYNALVEAFPHENPDHLLQVVEHFIYQKYFNPVIVGPELFGIADKALTPMQKKNLNEVSKVLNQISAGQFFTHSDDVYLQPLNEWLEEAHIRMFGIFKRFINVPVLEKQFDMDEFDDLTCRQNPTLYIKMADVFALHSLIAKDIDFVAPEREDQIRDLIRELGNVKNHDDELQRASGAEISLTLNPRLSKVEDPESEVKALFVETKRCVLYIIRVQTGGNLMDILVKPITEEDEERWAAVVAEESSGKRRGAYADATHTLSDISMLSYSELKKIALENVLKLEQTGKISRQNQFQDILNAIATDIRTKHRRREQRHRELDGVQQTLSHLDEKAQFLDEKLKSYNDYIEQAMSTLQSTKKKGKRGFIFSRQYFHIRELEKSGKVPKFGSFKYSARNLSEKGVLVSMEGYDDRQYDKISFTLSSDEVGVFFIEASYGSMMIPGGSAHVPLDDLLQAQFNNHQFMSLFEGMVKLNVNLFLHLLFKKFYRDG